MEVVPHLGREANGDVALQRATSTKAAVFVDMEVELVWGHVIGPTDSFILTLEVGCSASAITPNHPLAGRGMDWQTLAR